MNKRKTTTLLMVLALVWAVLLGAAFPGAATGISTGQTEDERLAARATEEPVSISGSSIIAGSNDLVIKEEGSGTTIYIDKNKNGEVDFDEKSLEAEGILDAPLDGADLSKRFIYAGVRNTGTPGDVKVTMKSGEVEGLFAGPFGVNMDGTSYIQIVGGKVGYVYAYGQALSSSGGIPGSIDIKISGGDIGALFADEKSVAGGRRVSITGKVTIFGYGIELKNNVFETFHIGVIDKSSRIIVRVPNAWENGKAIATCEVPDIVSQVEVKNISGAAKTIYYDDGKIKLGAPSAPSITTTSLPDATVGTNYNFTMAADGTTPITWSVTGTLPKGLAFDTSTGVISGTPTTAGIESLEFKAENADGSDSKTLLLNVKQKQVPQNPGGGTITDKPPIITAKPPIIATDTSTTPPAATAGKEYKLELKATGSTPMTWSLESGRLPRGLALDSEMGIISGTPTETGSFDFTVKVSNSEGSSTQRITIEVEAASTATIQKPPVITTSAFAGGKEGEAYSQQLAAMSDAPVAWEVASGTLPVGLTLDASTGVISGTPTVPGSYSFTVSATNAYGSINMDINIVVDKQPQAEQPKPPVPANQGWVQEGSQWHYYSDGKARTGWQKLEWNGRADWYYFDGSGVMQTGWEKVEWNGQTDWYYFNGSGAMHNGWFEDGDTWYYLSGGGAMAKGWHQLEWNGQTDWYCFNGNGAMLTGTHVIDGVTYKLDNAGRWTS